MDGRELSGVKGPAVAASYLFVVFFNILRIERLVVSGRTVGRVGEEAGGEKKKKERETGRDSGERVVFKYASHVMALEL